MKKINKVTHIKKRKKMNKKEKTEFKDSCEKIVTAWNGYREPYLYEIATIRLFDAFRSVETFFREYKIEELSASLTELSVRCARILSKGNEAKLESILTNAIEIQEAKNKDYGNSFEKTCNKYGLIASIVRMSDKVNRILQLSKYHSSLIKDEKLEDTVLDLMVYAIMTITYIENNMKEY